MSINSQIPPLPLTTPLLTGVSVESAESPALPKTGLDRGMLTMPWIMFLQWLADQSGTAVSVDVPFVTPEQFGAIGDGVADDTTAVQDAIDDGRAVMMHSEAIYAVSNLSLRSGLTIFGLPGATVLQLPGAGGVDVPFVGGSGLLKIYIQGVTFDGNVANNPVLGVTTLFLEDTAEVILLNCEFKNCSGNGIGGVIWNNWQIVGCKAANWGIGNDYAAIYKQDGTLAPLPTGASSDILITQCELDGTGSGSCIKLTNTAAAPLNGYRIVDNYCKCGYPGPTPPFGAPDALAIEVWSGPAGTGGNTHFGGVVSGNKIDSEVIPTFDYGYSWGISISQGEDVSITGNQIDNCGVFAIELIGSRMTCTGNECSNCGPITIIVATIMASQKTMLVSGNINITRIGLQVSGAPLAGIHVYIEGTGDLARLIMADNQLEIQGAQRGIWIQANGSGGISDVGVSENIITGDSTAASFGVVISPDGIGSSIDFVTLEANRFSGVETAINIAGTNGRYLWNIFGSGITDNYSGPGDATDMIVDVSNTEGVNFAPPSIQIRGRDAAVIDASGNIFMDEGNDTARIAMAHDAVATNPSIGTWNRVVFGSELQGNVTSVNSRFDGFPDWVQTSVSAYVRAMFLTMGAARFAVRFGLATNADGADPGSIAFYVTDPSNGSGAAGGVFTGGGYPLYVEELRMLRSGTGDPNGSIVGTVGDLYLRSGIGVYQKSSGTATNTGWTLIPVSAGSGSVTSVALSLPSIITVSGSPVTTSGTLTGTLATQTANTVWAGPTTGAAATPTFRALDVADLPGYTAGTYTPGGTNLTGASAASGSYRTLAGWCDFQATITGTPTVTTNPVVVTIPVTPANNDQTFPISMVVGGSRVGGVGTLSGTNFSIQYANPTAFSAASHVFVWSGSYKI